MLLKHQCPAEICNQKRGRLQPPFRKFCPLCSGFSPCHNLWSLCTFTFYSASFIPGSANSLYCSRSCIYQKVEKSLASWFILPKEQKCILGGQLFHSYRSDLRQARNKWYSWNAVSYIGLATPLLLYQNNFSVLSQFQTGYIKILRGWCLPIAMSWEWKLGWAGRVFWAVTWEMSSSFHYNESNLHHLLPASWGHYHCAEQRSSALTEGGLWHSADTLLSTGGVGVKQWAGQDKVSLPCCPLEKQWPWSPCLGFLSITCVLCRDLLYISKGLRDCFFHLVFWRTGRFVRLWWGVYCLKPHVRIILIACPERGCFLRKCLLNTLKWDDLSSVTLTVWFPEELWQC